MKYKIAETFYSVQGEGDWVGTPASFIRLARCNVHCEWCDTDYSVHREASIDELVAEVLSKPAKKVIITGGEPALQDTQPLVVELRKHKIKTHVETNGTLPMHFDWDWVTVSPKGPVEGLDPLVMHMANEVKFVISDKASIVYMEEVLAKYPIKQKFVIPLSRPWPYKLADSFIPENMQAALSYCLVNPDFRLCVQLHKVIGVR